MFSRIGALVFGVLVGGIAVYASLHYHFLRAQDGWHFVPKAETTFSETYVDIRQFKAGDWREHPEVAAAVVKAGKGDLFGDAAVNTLFSRAEKLLETIQK